MDPDPPAPQPQDHGHDEAGASALLLRCASGDRRAFAEIYDRFADAVYANSLTLLGSPSEAEANAQAAFIKVWQRASRFDPDRGKSTTWILTITRNCALDRLRSDRRHHDKIRRSAELDPPPDRDPDGAPLTHLVSSERRAEIRGAIASLDPDLHETVDLVFFKGLTQPEISAQLGVPAATVKSRLRRALDQLRLALDLDGLER